MTRRPARPLPLRRQALLVLAALLLLLAVGGSGASALPTGFQETTVFTGLTNPAAIEFAADGRVFVAEKGGRIKVFDSLSDSSPDLFANLSANVHDFWDRGMLGFALDPDFTSGSPYVYVLYTYDAPIGGSPPTWGDGCPNPPGATGDGCVVSARLSRLTAAGNFMTGPEQVLINDWCQQYPSHSIGSLAFGADGALYVSGGDGASFNFVDWGQDGNPLNPCGDPPGGVGATLTTPTAEGGALRSQDLRTPSDPVALNGAILRVDPETGQGMLDNPLAASADPNARRIIAYGLRNPFRLTIRPGTNEVWLGDVGWGTWEEINRIANPLGSVENFGWPCYEGSVLHTGYGGGILNMCEDLYDDGLGAVVAPYYAYNHNAKVVAGETCPSGSSSIAGTAFYPSGPFPDSYDDALFFADYSRDCIWVMFAGGNGLPNASNRATFVAPAANPVDLQVGPDGALYYADFDGGTIRRIAYSANQPPSAVASGSPTDGPAPLTVAFDGSGSSDPEGGPLTYAWDLDGDGAFDDSTAVSPSHTYTQPGTYNAKLRVTDAQTQSATSAPVTISANNTPPTATIDAPAAATTWKVGDTIAFSGSATDPQQGTLPGSALSWQLILHHCPSNCHTHPLQTFTGVASGSFAAPDHEYPSYLELRLTATDGGGLTNTKTLQLDPKTVELSFASSPAGLQLTVGGSTSTTPFTRTVIEGSTNSISAPSPQTLGGTSYAWASWSDGGAQSHNVVANAAATYTAAYAANNTPPTATINAPAAGTTWKVGDVIAFSGSASDPQQGTLPAAALSWALILHHCPSSCHQHPLQTWFGVASGSFTAPDHEYPSHLELRLTATDGGGLTNTKTLQLDPRTVVLSFQSSPSGLQLVVGGSSNTTPFTRTVIEGSNNSISAPTPQTLGGTSYAWVSWSDGGARSHNVVASSAATYTAAYQAVPPPPSADLALAKTGALNGVATWTLSVSNQGPGAATNVVVTDTLPSRVSFVSAPGCTYVSSTRTVRCELASLAQGGTATFTITSSVTGKGSGWITNTAQVSSSTPDPSTANNIASARLRFGPSAWIGTATVEVAANGRALTLVRCRATSGGCRGSITFERRDGAVRTRTGRRHRLVARLSSGSFRLRAGEGRRVPVRLTSRGIALLRARHQLNIRGVVVSRDVSGHRTTASRLVVLRTPRKARQ
jgi:uncharacterized repeat protein (TIGR01451 family)